ncbi:hypothetical protein RhiirA4_493025 [Rhizophagus irregularis]|uniref:Uncharacterized protein n=1 Tax=Rhizophagus irregularis TaxID=588596 RepID=A0A2I1HXG6_9GLOM|nr:hypothetical protein RhiirA4_493025 [Rhizophagus irregularis]
MTSCEITITYLITRLINKLPFDNLIDVDEFLHIDDCLKSNEKLTDNEIVSIIKSNNNNEPKMDLDKELPVVIPEIKVLNYLDDLVLFFKHLLDICINPNELISNPCTNRTTP